MNQKQRSTDKIVIFGAVAASLILFEFIFFRNVLMTSSMFGDNNDGRLTMLITEHWYRVLRGKEALADLSIFFPAKNTLAYSDMFLGYGIVHAILRFIGMDFFDSFKYTVVLFHLLGSVTLYYLLSEVLGVSKICSVLGVVLFSFSNCYALSFIHTQMTAISLLPSFGIFSIRFYQNITDRKRRNIYAYCALSVAVLTVYTAWYIAFFLALFVVICAIAALIALRRRFVSFAGGIIRECKWDILGYLAAAVVLLLPFLILELRVLHMSGGRSFNDLVPFIPEPLDILNIGSGNLLFEKLISGIRFSDVSYGETRVGLTPVNIFLFIIALFLFLYKPGQKNGTNYPGSIITKETQGVILAGIVIGFCLSVKIPNTGYSLWRLVFSFFPGGKSIRAIARFWFFLSLPLSVFISVELNKLINLFPDEKGKDSFLILLFIVIVFAGNLTREGVISSWNKETELAFLKNMEQPPDECKIFALTCGEVQEKPVYLYQVDAFEIADYYDLVTVNGYSGVTPEGWKLWEVGGAEYPDNLQEWIDRNDIRSLYLYDEAENNWEKVI